MRSGFADAGGVRIHFLDHGNGGRPLVVVHATGFHAHLWDPWIPALRPRFRVVAIDQRGHGLSDKPADGYDWQRFGEDVLAVVDHLGLEAPAGMGHSAGGAALVMAESLRPGTFSRLVLLDPVTPPPALREAMASAANPLAAAARRRRAVWASREQMAERLRTSALGVWQEEFLWAYVRHGTVPLPEGGFALLCPPEVEAQVFEAGGRHDGWERLAAVSCPTLLVVGEHSELWGPELRQEAAARLPRGRLEVIPGAGHFFPMQRPAETLERVLAFLEV